MIEDRKTWESLISKLINKSLDYQNDPKGQYKDYDVSQHFLRGCQFILHSLFDTKEFNNIVSLLNSQVDKYDPNMMARQSNVE